MRGSCSAAVITISEGAGQPRLQRQHRRRRQLHHERGGTLQGSFSFSGVLSGSSDGSSFGADETLTFTSGCAGQRVVYRYILSR